MRLGLSNNPFLWPADFVKGMATLVGSLWGSPDRAAGTRRGEQIYSDQMAERRLYSHDGYKDKSTDSDYKDFSREQADDQLAYLEDKYRSGGGNNFDGGQQSNQIKYSTTAIEDIPIGNFRGNVKELFEKNNMPKDMSADEFARHYHPDFVRNVAAAFSTEGRIADGTNPDITGARIDVIRGYLQAADVPENKISSFMSEAASYFRKDGHVNSYELTKALMDSGIKPKRLTENGDQIFKDGEFVKIAYPAALAKHEGMLSSNASPSDGWDKATKQVEETKKVKPSGETTSVYEEYLGDAVIPSTATQNKKSPEDGISLDELFM